MGRCALTVTVGERVRAGFTHEVPHFETIGARRARPDPPVPSTGSVGPAVP
jgi:hypothetical protein